MKATVITMLLIAVFGAAMALAAEKQTVPATDHAATSHGAPAATDAKGPWSYSGRKNPEPYKQGRWEMVPVPGYGHMHIDAARLSPELRCAALRDPRVMVDRATRAACDNARAPSNP